MRETTSDSSRCRPGDAKRIARADFKPKLSANQRKLKDKIVEEHRKAGFAPPEPASFANQAAGNATALRDIYEAMKRHHWFLTGPEDFPVCAMLVGRPGTPAEIGAGTDALYRALHDRADLWRGDSLQTAANMLYLTGVEPPVLVERFATILAGFREAGTRIGQEQYDELAILCFLARPTATIVTTVTAYRDRLRPAIPWLTRTDALNLAASLAFIEIAGQDPDALGPLADVKLLLDMQAIVAARAAATA